MNNEKKIQTIIQQKTAIPKEVEEKICNTYSMIRNEEIKMKHKKMFRYKRFSVAIAILICLGAFVTMPSVRASVLNIITLWSNGNDQGIDNALQHGIYQNIEGISSTCNGITIEAVTIFSDLNRLGLTFKLDIPKHKKLMLKDGNGGGFDYTIAKNNNDPMFAFARVESSPLKPYNPYNLYPSDKLYEVDGEYYYNILLSSTDSLFKDTTSIQFESKLLTLHESFGFKEYAGDWKLTIPIEQNQDKYTYSPINNDDKIKINEATSTPFGFVIDYVLVNQHALNEMVVTDFSITDENGNQFNPTHGFTVTDTAEGTSVVVFIESPFYNQSETLTLNCISGLDTTSEVKLIRN